MRRFIADSIGPWPSCLEIRSTSTAVNGATRKLGLIAAMSANGAMVSASRPPSSIAVWCGMSTPSAPA
jgi:hypothetical protein